MTIAQRQNVLFPAFLRSARCVLRVETYEELHGGQFFLCGTRETLRIRGATQYAFIAVPCPSPCASRDEAGARAACSLTLVHTRTPFTNGRRSRDPFVSPLSGAVRRASVRSPPRFRFTAGIQRPTDVEGHLLDHRREDAPRESPPAASLLGPPAPAAVAYEIRNSLTRLTSARESGAHVARIKNGARQPAIAICSTFCKIVVFFVLRNYSVSRDCAGNMGVCARVCVRANACAFVVCMCGGAEREGEETRAAGRGKQRS